jgi:hypothetical protein
MRFAHVNRYPASATEVFAMLTTRGFREQVCERQHAVEHEVEITARGAGALVVVHRTMSMRGAPSAATRITGDTVRLVQREEWEGPDRARFALEIPGKPGHVRGQIDLREGGDGCDAVFDGVAKVSIPLVGGKIERLVTDILAHGLRREGEVGVTWLASGPA